MSLTTQQIAHYQQQGFVCPLDAYAPDEAVRNRSAFDALAERFRRDGHDAYAINGYHASCRSIYDIVRHPAILDAVGSLIDGPFIAWGSHFFNKLAHDPRSVAWHQDAPYWPLTPMATVTAWIAIDDVDDANSAVRVVPGSHRHGVLPKRTSRPDERNVLGTTIDLPADAPAPHSLCMRAGQFSLHHDLLVHGSLPNTSDRRRCGLTVRYAPIAVHTGPSGWNQNAILCRGSDTTGHWVLRPRPLADEPRHGNRIIGAN